MDDNRYKDFLEKILLRTKTKKLRWDYLDGNSVLYEGMHWTREETELGIIVNRILRPDFDVENSFYCRFDGGYLVILVKYTQPPSFYVVPTTFKNVVTLPAELYGNYITRLLNLVQSFFPDGESFIDSILQDDGED